MKSENLTSSTLFKQKNSKIKNIREIKILFLCKNSK